MQGAAWFHVTGITPALGKHCAEATARARLPRPSGPARRVSIDLNYRKKLWTEAQAQATMRPLMRDVDVVIANEEDLQAVLGMPVAGADVTGGALDVAAAIAPRPSASRASSARRWSRSRLRESLSASDNGWSAVLWDANTETMHQSQRYDVRLVDRIGGGDSFAAGLIYALLAGPPARRGAAVRGRGERAQADDPRRLQSRDAWPKSTRWPRVTRPAACSADRRLLTKSRWERRSRRIFCTIRFRDFRTLRVFVMNRPS